jgi:hypothetical protein
MKLKYTGKHTAGVEVVIDGQAIPVEHGGTIEIDAERAKSLIESGEYTKVGKKNEEAD